MDYKAKDSRYDDVSYVRCGKSGLKFPPVSLGLWHNFGGHDIIENSRQMLLKAFDMGITHFDLANNYGPPYGSAEITFGKILKADLKSYRDELIISSKAGWDMWPGPYGDWGSRKYLIASLDQSLKRLGLDYVDIFYHHRPDPETPIEETMAALSQMVRSGKALYVGISQYSAKQSKKASIILRDLGTPCLIHQPNYNIFDRWIEDGLLDVLDIEGIGCIVFSPLAQGVLTNKYIDSIPANSRAGRAGTFLDAATITEELRDKIKKLDSIAMARNQTLAQMAIAWVLRKKAVTSAIIGASNINQIEDCLKSLDNQNFSEEELNKIDEISLK
ncbi:MAG: aldo/keto reductase [Ignavibacteriaceae bacterium]